MFATLGREGAPAFATDREPDSRLPIYHLGALKTGHPQMTDESCVDQGCVDHAVDEPITLHRIMQEMIGEGLRERYKPPQKLSHELLVLLIQLKEQERREAAAAKCRSARS
ncbi:MAG: hypothetical protein WBQ24_16745 [Xanthobacteraceae bacterium]